MNRRVVVTGIGLSTALGTGVETVWRGLIEGRSGIGPISLFDASALRSRIAGEVRDLSAEDRLPSKIVRRHARFSQLALVAALEAIDRSALPEAGREDVAVVLGSGIGGFELLNEEHEVFLERGPGRIAPLTVPMIIPNMAAGLVSIETGCRGPNICLSTACATGAHSIGTALDLIRNRRAEVALAGATESTISAFAVEGYCQLRALSTRNESPRTASRPFSRGRDGFVIAEGAAVLVLESLEHAQARGARPLAELAGYGASSDGYHATAPDPESRGAVRAMRAALADAGMSPADIEVVNAHGTSTPLNDVAETKAIKEVFGDHARRLAVHATKSMIGHALGGASAIEAAVAVLTIERGVIHPTINLDEPDPECDLDYVPNVARERKVTTVMSNAFGFGGHNGVLVFRAVDPG
jgi:3-oxoacyl-[acyl-carrier-protein] synthase II